MLELQQLCRELNERKRDEYTDSEYYQTLAANASTAIPEHEFIFGREDIRQRVISPVLETISREEDNHGELLQSLYDLMGCQKFIQPFEKSEKDAMWER